MGILGLKINKLNKGGELAKYLITVRGYDYWYSPSVETVSVIKTLKGDRTPVDWFLSKPKVHSRFDFVPNALINFWKISEK